MRRFVGIAFLAAALFGCASPHLGDGYGRRTRGALDAQTQTRGEVNRAIDGTDARLVLRQHRDTGAPPGADENRITSSAILLPTISSSGSSSSYTREMPAGGAVRLDATK